MWGNITSKTAVELRRNCKVSLYPDGSCKVAIASQPVYMPEWWEARDKGRAVGPCPSPEAAASSAASPRADSLRRSKSRIFDIGACNSWDVFATLTIDPQKVDSYDPKAVMARLRPWLSNGVQRKHWRYLLVPEHHKSGRIHMHALMAGQMRLGDSGHKTRDGKAVLHLLDWPYGWTTALPLTEGTMSAVSRYICKYVTKETSLIFGNRYLAGGRGLVRGPRVVLADVCYNDFELRSYQPPDCPVAYKYVDCRVEDLRELGVIL